jgi:hypothetical protein
MNALCLDCNYPLGNLPASRCPECGRDFDPRNPATFNSARPLNALDRTLLAPVGPFTFAAAGLPCAAMLHLSLNSGIYYLWLYALFLFLMCCVVAAAVGVRLLLRAVVPPAGVPRPRDRRRVVAIGAATAVTCALVIAQVPLRIAFLCSRPQLDRLVADVRSGKVAEPVTPRRAGLFTVASSSSYGGGDTLFFEYALLGQQGGIAYCPTDGPEGHYNTGSDGPLGWRWYWWTDD